MSSTPVRVVLCTCPPSAAVGVARTLLEERLAACVNIVPKVRSLYWWQDAVADDEESLLVIKTQEERYVALEERLQAIHPYDVPEVLSLAVEDGADAYISWVFDSTRS